MARLVTSGFEFNDLGSPTTSSPDGKRSNSNTIFDTGTVRTGSVSLKANFATGTGSNDWAFTAVSLGVDAFARIYIYVPTGSLVAGGNSGIIGMGPGGLLAEIMLETDGTLTLWASIAGVFTQQGSASAAITLDAWNRVELRLRVDTGSVDQVEARLNGSSFASTSSLNISDSLTAAGKVGAFGTVSGGTTATSGIIYFDDVAVNDSSGASQNSWPGDSKIVLLRPTADSAVGTGWTLGNGTATGGNAWQRLNKAPPDSDADLTANADAMQIRNATSNANVNYDATMTTYTAAGVTGTVNVVVPVIATGAPVVTSAKAGTVGVASNPAITNVALGAAGTAGAFWSGVAMGFYATGNKWSFGTTTYAPTVTLGTAPVMRVTQVTASTRIAIVTEMGIYVDYTPAVTTLPPLPVYVDSAVARSTSY